MRASFRLRFSLTITALLWLLSSLSAIAQSVSAGAESVYLYDMSADRILMTKNPNQRMGPASMTKIMTAYLAFEALSQGTITEDTTFRVSDRAYQIKGSSMFLEPNETPTVEELLMGILVQSGNDASVALAEGIAGSEDQFAQLMTLKAQQLGMTDSQFINASGWPDPEHYSTPKDMVTLVQAIIKDFPEYYGLFSEKTYSHNGISQNNRNPLLYVDALQVDGVKTGHTQNDGYGMIISSERQGRRLILFLHGLPSERARRREGARLLERGFTRWTYHEFFPSGSVVATLPAQLAGQDQIDLTVSAPFAVSLTTVEAYNMRVFIDYSDPIMGPIAQGEAVATLRVISDETQIRTMPLVAVRDRKAENIFARQLYKIGHIFRQRSERE